MRRFVVIISLTLFAFLTATQTVKAVDLGGVSAYPANPTDDERTSAWFVYTLASGETKNDALIIKNDTDKGKTFDLYPADSTPTTGNGFALKQKVETMTGVGSWVKLEKNSVTLGAHQSSTVPFSVALPKDLPPGLYAGGIMIAERVNSKEKGGVNIDLRMGVRMYITTMAKNATMANGASSKLYAIAVAATLAAALAAIVIIRRKHVKSS